MDASQYKDYVLVLLFVKYGSDRYAGQKNALLDVRAGGSFADMVTLKGTKDIGEGMNKIISKRAEANDLKGVIDVADFNEPDKLGKGKEMVDRERAHLIEPTPSVRFLPVLDRNFPPLAPVSGRAERCPPGSFDLDLVIPESLPPSVR